MHKVYLNFILILSFCCLSGCQNKEIVEKIEGVWIFDYRINNLYLNDTTNFFRSPAPTIVDFDRNGDIMIKNFGYRDTTMNWRLNSDTLIQLGDLEYRLHSVTKDSLTIIDYNPVDTFWIVYKRPTQTSIEYSQEDIKGILVKNIWTSSNEQRKWQNNIQYFDNNTQMFRYPMEDLDTGDSIENIQIESYGIGHHEGLYFLYNYIDWTTGNGNYESIYQLLNVQSNEYTLNEFEGGKSNKLTYTAKGFDSNLHQTTKSELIGRWNSMNSDKKSYGKHIPVRAIESGRLELLDGTLTFDLKKDGSGQILLNEEEYANIRWILSNDCSTLIFEHDINEEGRQGIYVEPVNILELSNDFIKARMYNTTYYTGNEKPHGYLLNIEQEFLREN